MKLHELLKGAYYTFVGFYDFPYVLIKAKKEEANKPFTFYLGIILGGLLWITMVESIHTQYNIPRESIITLNGITNIFSFLFHKRELENLIQS